MDAEDTCEKYAGEAVEPAKLSQTPLKLDARGLIPVVVQQWDTGEVLMVAWANQEAVRLTFETGTTWFWSRSRQELWLKGETSKNYQHIVSIVADCDKDALVVRVNKEGPACHTGAESCFHNPLFTSRTNR